MPSHFYMVLACPKAGREEDWLNWHKERHSHDMLEIPGIRRLRRFEASEVQPRGESPWRYMVLYELETDDIGSVINEIQRRFGTSLMPKTDASDPSKTVSLAWVPLSAETATNLMDGAGVSP